MSTGQCPSCHTTVESAVIEGVKLTAGTRATYPGVVYLCPQCKTILGMEADPLVLYSDIVTQIVGQLKPLIEKQKS